MPRIEQKLIAPGSDMEGVLADVRTRFVAQLGQPDQCDFTTFEKWLQAYAGPGGKLLGNCNIRADGLAPLLTKAGENSGWLKSMMNAPGKPIDQKWAAVATALNKGRALIIEGRGTEISGDQSNFADSKTFHAFVLLQSIEDRDGKKWFIGFDPDVSATTETRTLWNSLIRAAFRTQDEQLASWNEKVRDLNGNALHEVLTKMILGTTPNGFGPLVRAYAIDRTRGLEPPFRG
jgi:hypothetical protein